MFAFKTPLMRTVNLVESRVTDNTSDDPLKDLAFLSDHYSSKHEWDKANAATRHMLAVAEGNVSSSFQITPVDLELHETKKRLRRQSDERFWFRLALASILLFVAYVAVDYAQNNPKLLLDVRAQICALDPMTFVDRSNYFYQESKLTEALSECDKALALDSKNSDALQQKSYILYCLGDYHQAMLINELSDHKTWRYYSNQTTIEDALGNHKTAIASSEMEYAIRPRSILLYSVAWQAARAGDYEKALRFAQLETLKSTTDHDKAEGLSQEARYLVRLGRYDEAIKASTASINVTNKPLFSRAYTYRAEAKYNLSQYKEALLDACTAINMDYTDYRAYTVRAKCFQMLGRADDAEAEFEMADTWRNVRDT